MSYWLRLSNENAVLSCEFSFKNRLVIMLVGVLIRMGEILAFRHTQNLKLIATVNAIPKIVRHHHFHDCPEIQYCYG
jgi:hypothetical protein